MNGERGWDGNETINWHLRWDRHLVNCDHEQHPDPGSDGLADVCLHLVCDRLLRHAGGVDDHGTVNDLARARGPQLWVKTAFRPKWGFTSSWLLWVQMFPSMVMIASTLCPLFGVMIGQDQLGDNHWFTLAFIIVFYWLITLLNLKFDMAKIGGAIGIWLGVYLPMGLMFILVKSKMLV